MVENNIDLYRLMHEYVDLQRFYKKNNGFIRSYAEYGIESESDALKRKTENSVMLQKELKYKSLLKENSSKLLVVEKTFQLLKEKIGYLDKNCLTVCSWFDTKEMPYSSDPYSFNYVTLNFNLDDIDIKAKSQLQKIAENHSMINITGYFKFIGGKVYQGKSEFNVLTVFAKLISFEELETDQNKPDKPKKSGLFHWF